MSELREQDVQVGTGDELHAKIRPLLGGEELMSWTIKALPHPMLPVDIAMAIGALMPIGLMLYGVFGERASGVGDDKYIGLFGLCLWLFLWKKGARQKNVYNYRITDQGGEVEYWMDFPEGVGTFFKWFTGICLFVVICMIAVEPSFFWMLAGPGGMAIVGARSLIGWENKRKYDWFRWDEFDHVIIDRKRKIVVFLDNPIAFEAFLEKSQIDKYLEVVHLYMPPHTRFEEERWMN